MKEFLKIFKKVNGIQVIKEYFLNGYFVIVSLLVMLLGISKKSLEIIRLIVEHKTVSRLRRKYKDYISVYSCKEPKERKEKIIWLCWFQGIENAPEIVQKCYESVKETFSDYKINVLTDENIKEFVQFPDYIWEKYSNGIITKTHFSDILRLELLSKYGGIWIDATVYVSNKNIPKYMEENDLFLFQCLKPGLDGHATAISSWFMSSCKHNPIVELTRDLLYEYWKKNNRMCDYFLLHNFMQLAIEKYPEEWKKVIPFSNAMPHILLLNFFEEYEKEWLDTVLQLSPIHKLSYKFTEEQMQKDGTYYKWFINRKIGE